MADEHRATTAELTLTNAADLAERAAGTRPAAAVRSVVVPNAVVAAGVPTTLIVPEPLLRQLGLAERQRKPSVTPGGVAEVAVWQPVRVEWGGAAALAEPAAAAAGPVLVGEVVREALGRVQSPA